MRDTPMIRGWVRWSDRDGFVGIDCPGVYMISRYRSDMLFLQTPTMWSLY